LAKSANDERWKTLNVE